MYYYIFDDVILCTILSDASDFVTKQQAETFVIVYDAIGLVSLMTYFYVLSSPPVFDFDMIFDASVTD
jgi:hypothetical protein